MADECGRFASKSTASRASRGPSGFDAPGLHSSRSSSHCRTPPALRHPRHRSTFGDAANTQASSSGSRTIASARSFQPLSANRPRTSSARIPGETSSRPLPCRSNHDEGAPELSRERRQDTMGLSHAARVMSRVNEGLDRDAADAEGLWPAQQTPNAIVHVLVGDQHDKVLLYPGHSSNRALRSRTGSRGRFRPSTASAEGARTRSRRPSPRRGSLQSTGLAPAWQC